LSTLSLYNNYVYMCHFRIGSCDVSCEICEQIWVQPATFKCGHTFCCQCILKEADIHCKLCKEFLSGADLDNSCALSALESFYKDTHLKPRGEADISDLVEFEVDHLYLLLKYVCGQSPRDPPVAELPEDAQNFYS